MPPTQLSRREVSRTIAATSYREWPAYNSTPLYDRTSLGGLEEDVRTVANVWFEHDAHESVENFVCCLPLAYVEFEATGNGDLKLGSSILGRTRLLSHVRVF